MQSLRIRRRRSAACWVAPVALVMLGACGGSAASSTTSTTGGSTSTSTTAAATHGDGEAVVIEGRPNITEFAGPDRAALGAQLVTARQVALRYPTRADAEAAGYEPTTPYAPGTGSHMGRDDQAQPPDAPLDLAKPQSYLYDGNDPTSHVVGLMYVQLGGDEPPEGFAGPLDTWQGFHGQCLKADSFDPLFPAEDSITEERCTGAGGRFIDVTAWIQHVWVVPGWEAPGGVFAAYNSDIVCRDGTEVDPVDGCPSPVSWPPTSNNG